MKLMYFDDYKLGVVTGDGVVDVSSVVQDIPHAGPHDLINGLIARFGEYRSRLEEAARRGKAVALSGVRIRPPLPRPVNIDCMAVNYMEDGTRTEPAPINAFHKSPNAVIGSGDTMVLPDVPATIFEGEAEVAVVIGKQAKDVKAADAMGCVFGYVNFIDGSARGLPPPGNVFYQMKSRDTFAPIGPAIATGLNGEPRAVEGWVNDQRRQASSTKHLIFPIEHLIEFITFVMTLEPGDIISTGTPEGIGPLEHGDTVTIKVEGVGELANPVQDE